MTNAARTLVLGAGGLFCLLGVASRTRAELHECKDAAGTVVFQNDPCVETKRRPAVEPRRESPAAPTPIAPPAPAAFRPVPRGAPTPAPPTLDGPAPDADPRFASPERTWETFVEAVRSGDRAAALACLTSSALEKVGPRPEGFPLAAMRELVDSITRFEVEREAGPLRPLRGDRGDGRPKWIFLERTAGGAWKIAAI